MQLSQFRKGCVRKYISSAEVRTKRVTADPSTPSFGRPRRIADARGNDSRRVNRRLLAEKVFHEIPGASPLSTLQADAAARTCAAAVNATM
jgi:hypothetical protein